MGKGVCGNQGAGEKIIYAWGRNAPDLKLPKGTVGIKTKNVVRIVENEIVEFV